MAMKNNDPAYGKPAFTCPCCNAIAQMTWVYFKTDKFDSNRLGQAKCLACKQVSVWRASLDAAQQLMSDFAAAGATVQVHGVMLYPAKTVAPFANKDLPDDCKADFEEARQILMLSPRGAAALLRLIVQKLCLRFGEEGKNINDDIRSLVKKGKLHPEVQQALDVVRLVGNNAVHPGEIQVEDNVDLVENLFGLINYIVDEMISRPNQRAALFQQMPAKAKDAIARQDASKV